MAASPWPPPPQSAAAPSPPPRRRSSLIEREHDARARHADRVTERDRAAVHVDDVVGDAEVAHRRDPDRGERLVELEEVDVADLHVDGLERALDRTRRLREQRRVGAGDHAEAHELGDRRERRAPRPWPRLMTMTAAPPSEICDALPAVMVPSFANAGRRPPSDSVVVPGRTPSSVSTTTGSPLRCGIATGDDLVGEPAVLDRGRGALVALGRELVLRLAGDAAELAGVLLGARAHVHRVERAPQAVADHRVDAARRCPCGSPRAPWAAGTARWSSTPCRRRPRPRRRPPGSSGRRGRSR